MDIKFCLPEKISPAEFLAQYWQKKPLLIKNGLPQLAGMFEPTDVLELATCPEAQTRLLCQTQGKQGDVWTLKQGPLSEEDLQNVPALWTVLVQNLEQWSPELGQLWRAFDFVPRWQQDDIMVSYAPNGGSVGAHFDEYDVFLAQGYGKRRWILGKFCDADDAFAPDRPIRLLDDMGEAIFDEILQPGDVLYVPARLAHHGVAVGDCLTFSFGFRRPNAAQILDKLADGAGDFAAALRPFDLPQGLQGDSAELSCASLDALKAQIVAFLASKEADAWFCHAVASLLSERQYDLIAFEDEEAIDAASVKARINEGANLQINAACRFVRPQGKFWYINGEAHALSDAQSQLLGCALGGAALNKNTLVPFFAQGVDWQTLADWVRDKWLIVDDAFGD